MRIYTPPPPPGICNVYNITTITIYFFFALTKEWGLNQITKLWRNKLYWRSFKRIYIVYWNNLFHILLPVIDVIILSLEDLLAFSSSSFLLFCCCLQTEYLRAQIRWTWFRIGRYPPVLQKYGLFIYWSLVITGNLSKILLPLHDLKRKTAYTWSEGSQHSID